METFKQPTGGRGLWNNPRPSLCSKETQEMLKLRKEESRFMLLQRKQINRSTNRGADLSRISDSRPPPSKSAQHRPRMSQRRSAESCQAGNSYEREKFHPGPVRDLEKEKRRLQNIMATGTEEPETGSPGKLPGDSKQEESEETDRFQEVLNEIEERRQFLADMAALGQDHQYSSIINAEISQRLHELDILDQAGSSNQRTED
ncbi:PREDICTED: UPF0193 protein EVG1 [Cyprinodon variegatus]|uniref:UPF0193 protein EVG1 n=1 Tax=Cyprinodon variegatus TaxID=28743 RepID=UPI0007426D96|nr:PREDICTED: UPF0193 protein EVG1 [Cyprinodon variegatus]